MFRNLNEEFSKLVEKREELAKRLLGLANAKNEAERAMIDAMRHLVNVKTSQDLTHVDIKLIDARMRELARHGMRCPCDKCQQEMRMARVNAEKEVARSGRDTGNNFAPRSSAEYVLPLKKRRRETEKLAPVMTNEKTNEEVDPLDNLQIEIVENLTPKVKEGENHRSIEM